MKKRMASAVRSAAACLLMIALFSMLLFLQGCKEDKSLSENSTADFPKSRPGDELKMAENGEYVFSQKGMYTTQNIFPNSSNIIYIDFATQQQVPLCANPECSHSSEECTSYLTNDTPYPLMIMGTDKYLFAYNSGSEKNHPSVIRIDQDGSGRKTLFELESNQQLAAPIVTDEDFLYFPIRTIEKDGAELVSLVSADVNTGEVRCLTELEDNEEFIGCTQDKLCFAKTSLDKNAAAQYFVASTADPASMKKVFELPNERYISTFSDGCVYFIDPDTNEAGVYDLSTLSEKKIEYDRKPNSRPMGMTKAFDNMMILTMVDDTTHESSKILIDFDEAACFPMNLTYDFDDHTFDAEPICEYKDQLCVISGLYQYTLDLVNSDGTMSPFDYIGNQLALISKDDYKNSVPNYQNIVSAVGSK